MSWCQRSFFKMLTTIAVALLSFGLVFCQSTTTQQQAVRQIEAIRLVGGSNEREGRVEILSRGIWGTVCDDIFASDTNAARVVCRSLGFLTSPISTVFNLKFGNGTGPILLDDMLCTGRESSLNECAHGDIGVHNCRHDEDIGVVCTPRPITGIRLVDGPTPQVGGLEVQISGIWGSVCDDGFGEEAARVVCRALGFPTTNAQALMRHLPADPSDSRPIHLDDVICNGDEATLEHCQVEYENNCSHSEDVGVSCDCWLSIEIH